SCPPCEDQYVARARSSRLRVREPRHPLLRPCRSIPPGHLSSLPLRGRIHAWPEPLVSPRGQIQSHLVREGIDQFLCANRWPSLRLARQRSPSALTDKLAHRATDRLLRY